MVSAQDIILTLKGKDEASSVFNKVGSSLGGLKGNLSGMGSMLGSAFITASGQMANFAKDCVSSASTAEQELEPFWSSNK